MTVDLSTIRDSLGTWFSAVTGLAARDKEGQQHWGGTWNASKHTGAPKNAHGLMSLVVLNTYGTDETVYEYDAGEDELIPHMKGFREIIWEVQVLSWSQRAEEDATYYLMLIRDLLSAPSAIAAFKAASLGYQTVTPVRDLTATKSDRRPSRAVIEVTFNAVTDVSDADVGYVTTFEITSDLQFSDGSSLASDLQMSGEIPE